MKKFFIGANYFVILCWFLPYINVNQHQVYLCPLPLEPYFHLSPTPTPLGCHRTLRWAPWSHSKLGEKFFYCHLKFIRQMNHILEMISATWCLKWILTTLEFMAIATVVGYKIATVAQCVLQWILCTYDLQLPPYTRLHFSPPWMVSCTVCECFCI